MAVPTMEESALCSQLIERVKDYFQSAEHKKEFEEWYKTKYHKDYEFSHNTRPPIFCCVLFPDPRQSRDACGLTGYLYTPQRVLVVGLVKVPVFFHLV